jgi:50S ribosomal subunit-associated GTPase HflX
MLDEQKQQVLKVLAELDVKNKPIIEVMNKIVRLTARGPSSLLDRYRKFRERNQPSEVSLDDSRNSVIK